MVESTKVNDFVEKLSKLIEFDNDNSLIKLLVDRIINQVSTYTNIPVEELPQELDSEIILSLFSYCEDNKLFKDDDSPVSQVTEGDVTVSFAVSANKAVNLGNANLISDDLKHILNRYRRLL